MRGCRIHPAPEADTSATGLESPQRRVDVLQRPGFLGQYARQVELPAETVTLMGAYPWPGTVRELENFVRGLVVIGDVGYLSVCSIVWRGVIGGQSAIE
jgi:hypothetical protein